MATQMHGVTQESGVEASGKGWHRLNQTKYIVMQQSKLLKATDKVQEGRQRSKYMQTDDTPAAHRAYNRYDEGISPEDDLPIEKLLTISTKRR